MCRPGFLFLCAALLLVGCRGHGPSFDAHRPAALAGPATAFVTAGVTNQIQKSWLQAPTNFYTLGPGDSIGIEILGEPGSQTSSLVGPDGKIYYSLLPGKFVWGMTLSEVKAQLETDLARYIRVRPEVGITLNTVGSKRVWILGSVQSPGLYYLSTPTTLLEAISSAGGTLTAPGSTEEMADLKRSFVMRHGQLLPVDFYKLLREGDFSQNVYLQPDDFVYLRPGLSKEVYVLGAVAQPNLVPWRDQLSLATVVASAGGTLPYAYLSHVAIIRGSLSEPSIAVVDFKAIEKGRGSDVRLQPGDIVYIPFAPYRKLALFAEQIVNQFVRTIAINEGRNAVSRGGPVPVSVGLGGISP